MVKTFKSNTFKFVSIAIIFSLFSFLIISMFKSQFGFVMHGAIHGIGNEVKSVSLWIPRLKTVFMAGMSGGALGVAGLLLQKVTRNTLSDVSILGIGSINIIFITGYLLIFKDSVFGNGVASALLPLLTLFASILGTMVVWFFARSKKANSNKFIIVGISLQLLFEALAVVLINPTEISNNPDQAKIMARIKDYTVGMIDKDGTHWWLIIVSSITIGLCLAGAIMLRKKIDLIETNENLATTLGVNVHRTKLIVFLLVAVLAAAEAVMVGSVALLGIMAPALARMLFKNKTSLLLPASFFIGAILVLIATYISLTLDTQIPIGILSTAIVIPYFLYVVVRSK